MRLQIQYNNCISSHIYIPLDWLATLARKPLASLFQHCRYLPCRPDVVRVSTGYATPGNTDQIPICRPYSIPMLGYGAPPSSSTAMSLSTFAKSVVQNNILKGPSLGATSEKTTPLLDKATYCCLPSAADIQTTASCATTALRAVQCLHSSMQMDMPSSATSA